MPRDALKPEVLEHYLRLAQEVAPPTSKGKRGRRAWKRCSSRSSPVFTSTTAAQLDPQGFLSALQDLMEGPFPPVPGPLRRTAPGPQTP